MESSLDIQVGGSHYKKFTYQPVQFAVDMYLNFIQGNIVKYISRYKDKNGNEDLKKVLHYAQLGAELNPLNICPFHRVEEKVGEFIQKNNLSDVIGEIITAACHQDWPKVTIGIRKIYEYD